MNSKVLQDGSGKKQKKVTLRDIADALNVSKATVSLAMNGNSLVAEETRQKVLQKIEELGYVYNRGAASLSTGKSGTIGLAVHDITNPYFSRVCASIEAEMSMQGRMAFLCNTDESLERQKRFIMELCEHNADGLILCPAVGTTKKDLQLLKDKKIPTVLIARDVEGADFDFVGNDDQLSVKLATQHLIQLGHHRIAMLGGGSRTTVGMNRRAGFYEAMKDASIEVDPDLVIDCKISPEGGEEAFKIAFSNPTPPTAIVCFTDFIALGVLSALYDLGLKPGKDMAVIGCDGIAEGARSYIRLSTVHIQKAAIGLEAAEMLKRREDNPKMEIQHVIKEPRLIVRSTCGADQNKT